MCLAFSRNKFFRSHLFRLANVLLITYTYGNIYSIYFVAATQSFMKFKIESFCFGGTYYWIIFFRFFHTFKIFFLGFLFGFLSLFSLNDASSKKIRWCTFLKIWVKQRSNEMNHWVGIICKKRQVGFNPNLQWVEIWLWGVSNH